MLFVVRVDPSSPWSPGSLRLQALGQGWRVVVSSPLPLLVEHAAESLDDLVERRSEIASLPPTHDLWGPVDVNDDLDLTAVPFLHVDDVGRRRSLLVFGQGADLGLGPLEDALGHVTVTLGDADSHP